jgi:hypothetical protein
MPVRQSPLLRPKQTVKDLLLDVSNCLAASAPITQCAAVSMQHLLIITAPQKTLPFLLQSMACQGNSPGFVVSPFDDILGSFRPESPHARKTTIPLSNN